jgi:drug/metabolite transporter (DMT)-like permease
MLIAIFSWLIQGQGLSERGWLGGVLVLGGVWLSSSDKNELTKWEDLND